MTFEQPEQEKVLRVGEKEFRVGDPVTVIRSDGTIESDWTLKSFGSKVAVAEKVDSKEGVVMTKPIPLEEFLDQQTILEKLDAKNEMAVRLGRKTDAESLAKYWGIETRGKTVAQIQSELDAIIREATGT